MGKIWFTGDTHFGHANILKYCNRPFVDVSVMNEELISNWNDRVAPNDDIYHLGDVGMGNVIPILKRLNGRKHLIAGNHDKGHLKGSRDLAFRDQFVWVKDIWTLKVQDPTLAVNVQRIVLCHYAMRTWDRAHHGAWMLFGHSHNTMPDDPELLSVDVGVDCWNYAPVSYEELKVRMSTKTPRYLKLREQEI